ncbi:MAG: DPP IV N-terminal domain-containing protein [Candidatus Poribacteria bacterium]|nr:DPP IV N-terminal domain-containing protein [Candidatus Poribacteria bacterium]
MKHLKIFFLSHIRILFFTCCLLLFAGVTFSASAKIVFRVDGDIYIMNDDGSGKRRLTRNTVSKDRHARWSPDGKKIVFTRYMDKKKILTSAELFIMNADGTDPQRITYNNVSDEFPSWSPDGKRIVFQSHVNERAKPGLYVIELATRNVTQLTGVKNELGSGVPDWSPDGTQIVYTKYIVNRDGNTHGHPHKNIYVMSANGDDQRPFLPDPPANPDAFTARFFPRWSADGQRFAFADCTYREKERTCRLTIARTDGRTQVIEDIYDRLGGNIIATVPCWIENDRALLFALKEDGNFNANYDIFRYEFRTRSLRQLTRDAREEMDPDWIEGALSVSPQGKLPTLWGEKKQDLSQ